MIHYNLHCAAGHDFDGWFKDSAGFDAQAKARLVECPVCGGSEVRKALMTPAVAKAPGVKGRPESGRPEGKRPEGGRPEIGGPSPGQKPNAPMVPAPAMAPAPGGQQAAAGPVPAQLVALLQRMRAEVERNCTYVGPDFADQARRMHHGESEVRGIYGEASDADAEALRDEGIDIARLPWVPPADA